MVHTVIIIIIKFNMQTSIKEYDAYILQNYSRVSDQVHHNTCLRHCIAKICSVAILILILYGLI